MISAKNDVNGPNNVIRVWMPYVSRKSGLDSWYSSIRYGFIKWKSGFRIDVTPFPGVFFYLPLIPAWMIGRNFGTDYSNGHIHLNSWDGFSSGNKWGSSSVTVHRPPVKGHGTTEKVLRARERYILRSCDGGVGVSEYVCMRVEEEYGLRLNCIYNGVDTNLFRPESVDSDDKMVVREAVGSEFVEMLTEKGKVILLFVGNLSMRKGVDILETLGCKLDGRFRLVCVGDRRSGAGLSKCSGKILTTGWVHPHVLASIYRLSHIFLFPVREEGFGLVLAEAMSSGLPVIAGKTGPVPEILSEDGGLMISTKDVSKWIRSVRELSEEPDTMKQFGGVNRKIIVERFGLDRMIENYAGFFRELTHTSGAGER